jgi:hypothetical protein
MTQTPRTSDHLTPAVLTAATGVIVAPLEQVFAVIHDLTGGRLIPGEVAGMQDRIRAELIRQVPWLIEIRIPDFDAYEDPRLARTEFVKAVMEDHGCVVTLECDTLADIPGEVFNLPRNLTLVRIR